MIAASEFCFRCYFEHDDSYTLDYLFEITAETAEMIRKHYEATQLMASPSSQFDKGKVPVLTATFIERLSKRLEWRCEVCMHGCIKGDNLFESRHCGHKFHVQCIAWDFQGLS